MAKIVMPVIRLGDSDQLAGAISLVSASIIGGLDRVVTAVRDGGGNLKLISWRVPQSGAITRLGDSDQLAGAISLVDIGPALGPLGTSGVATAVRDGGGNLKLIYWGVSTNGAITRLADSDQLAGAISLVDIISGIASFKVVTAVGDGGGNLKLIQWSATG